MTFADFPFMKKQRSLDEVQVDNERLRVEEENAELNLSIEQKNYAFSKMKEAGLQYKKDFGSSLKRLWVWANKQG